jgi:signal transduction histidine kinase
MPGVEESKLFSGLSAAELDLVRSSGVLREHPANFEIFKEGDAGDGIYVVTDGQVQISALVGQDERRVLGKIGPGDFFGEMAVLDNEPRSATATTEVASKLVFIPRDKLMRMLEKSPRLAVRLVREFSLRMRDFNRRYIQEVLQAERLALVGRFARTIVHDFKNPLNIIGLSAELVSMEKATPEMRQTATARIRKQVDRLNDMISELLEFTRGSRSGVALGRANYAQFVRGIIAEVQPDIEPKGVKLVLRNEPPDLMLALDPKRLHHVFTNLIHNAVDAMPEGGEVFMSFETKAGEVVTEVEDTGPGIAPEILERLFEAFTTFGKAKGTGLGLSICKRIIEDHRGWIAARNGGEGKGAIFSFGLPAENE